MLIVITVSEIYFYPHSPCGERHPAVFVHNIRLIISIHTLLAESDVVTPERSSNRIRFLSTLSLRRATPPALLCFTLIQFLSTLSLRRATCNAGKVVKQDKISIHTLLAESDFIKRSDGLWKAISIHTLLAESDPARFRKWYRLRDFYPHSPCGERHRTCALLNCTPCISIHTLLAESDDTSKVVSTT